MTDSEIDIIITKLIASPLSSYQISKKTCITTQSIDNYRKKVTRPTQANAKLLEYFFANETDIGQTIIGNHNTMAGESIYASDPASVLDLKKTIREKDKIIQQLVETNAKLMEQLNNLLSKTLK